MFEYTVDLPLWDRTPRPEKWFGPIPRGALGLSVELEERLAAWNDCIEAALGRELAWPSPEARLDADVEGLLLAGALQEELGADMVVLYGDDGEPLQPPRATGPKRSSIVEQSADIPDTEFLEITRGVDLASLSWYPGRKPERLLLEPRTDGLPLADRTPLVGRAEDRVDSAALDIERDVLRRLDEWNERWRDAQRTLEYRTSGFQLAADLQRAVGPHLAVIFPEASVRDSEPTPEMQAFVDRLRALGD